MITNPSELKSGIAIVKLWAPWCGPCQRFAAVFESVASELSATTAVDKVGSVNVDEFEIFASSFGVRSIPAVVVLKDGALVGTVVGAMTGPELKLQLEQLIAKVRSGVREYVTLAQFLNEVDETLMPEKAVRALKEALMNVWLKLNQDQDLAMTKDLAVILEKAKA